MENKPYRTITVLMIWLNLVVFVSAGLFANTSDDPVLLQINGRKVTVSEFEYVYSKNNMNPRVLDPKTVDEYLELFINFNLKVHEARQMGMDTVASFIEELEGYRKQLAQPYLTDQDLNQQLLEEAFERMQSDIRASHILISVEQHASPADTLAAWEKINQLRNRIVQGEDFGTLAQEYSDDPSAKGMPATASRPAMRGNSGDLGYFSVLDMVYPFESAAFSTPVNEISEPVRTSFGYHIIKVTDRLPAMGRARVAHIMVSVPENKDKETEARKKIEEIYRQVLEGEDFASLAERFSDDKASGRRGGELPPFTSNRMVPEFISAVANMDEPGSVSEPIKTQYGWHIVKLFEKTKPDKEEALAELRNKISRDSRAILSQQAVVDKLKKDYSFVEHPQHLDIFFSVVDNRIFEARWSPEDVQGKDNVLFTFAGKTFTQEDFTSYLQRTQSVRTPESIRNYVNAMYLNFVNNTLVDFEEKQLENKYPEFKQIMQEYHDGILLFELTDKKVWSKAMQDTSGLREFFRAHQDKYLWDERFDAVIYTFNTEKAARSGRNAIRRAQRRSTSHEEVMAAFNKESQLEVSARKGVMEVEDHPVLKSAPREKGVSDVINHNNTFVIVRIDEYFPPQPRTFEEVRGLAIADYQNFLEEKWVNELREKYEITLHREALDVIFSE